MENAESAGNQFRDSGVVGGVQPNSFFDSGRVQPGIQFGEIAGVAVAGRGQVTQLGELGQRRRRRRPRTGRRVRPRRGVRSSPGRTSSAGSVIGSRARVRASRPSMHGRDEVGGHARPALEVVAVLDRAGQRHARVSRSSGCTPAGMPSNSGARRAGARLADPPRDRVEPLQHVARERQQCGTRGRERDAVGAALEQLLFQFVFEVLDPLAERGCGNVQLARGLGKVQLLGDRHEVAKVQHLHAVKRNRRCRRCAAWPCWSGCRSRRRGCGW